MFSNSRVLVFFNVLKKVSVCMSNIICIAQITFEFVNDALLFFERWFGFCYFDLIENFLTCEHWVQIAVYFLSKIGKLSSYNVS